VPGVIVKLKENWGGVTKRSGIIWWGMGTKNLEKSLDNTRMAESKCRSWITKFNLSH
jgi:hypothetical protein